MQRFFSSFARGWAGTGLLVQRVVTAGLLVCSVLVHNQTSYSPSITLQCLSLAAALLLFLGLWTPMAGVLAVVSQVLMALSHHSDPHTSVVVATLGATLAMIGPGTWSIDARLFGRKEIRL